MPDTKLECNAQWCNLQTSWGSLFSPLGFGGESNLFPPFLSLLKDQILVAGKRDVGEWRDLFFCAVLAHVGQKSLAPPDHDSMVGSQEQPLSTFTHFLCR